MKVCDVWMKVCDMWMKVCDVSVKLCDVSKMDGTWLKAQKVEYGFLLFALVLLFPFA